MALTSRDTALVTAQQAVVSLPGRVTTDDALVESLIVQASGQISDLCGRKFTQAGYLEYYDGPGTDTLWLDAWPVAGVSLWLDADGTFADSSLLTARSGGTGDYVVYGQERDLGKIRRINGVFPVGVQNVKVSYTGGYTELTMPETVRAACLKLIAYYYGRVKQGLQAVTTATVSKGGTVTLSDAILDELEPLLRPYRRPRLTA